MYWIEYGFPISCIRRLTSKEDYTMMLLCIVDIYFYHFWMNSFGNGKDDHSLEILNLPCAGKKVSRKIIRL